ncbi:ROK family transcriptional regulator [Aquibacillus sp. 3ASR75-11]|uniref:ROK family transcriptional regulator n=1 Tax=Terrihalobacillus insolitus TaxID=2950438 RepID=A0A9X3WUY8_9BACI|nr:ROK family transcriptional regulator [Terrihalobacillus insolitus]MDC3426372.1 ROK family transcriptional regulator [Terrihalobacillus insolitus]
MQRGTFKWMKSLNKSAILNKIRTSGPISRAQLAKDTKLTPPTVSTIVKELIDEGIVKESSLGESQGGRKPTMLVINSSAFYIIGVDAGSQSVDYVLSDLSGKIIDRSSRELLSSVTKNEFLSILKDGIHAIFQTNLNNKDNVIGIGVAMHGVVDIDTGTSLFAPNLGLTDIPIKVVLEKEFDLIVKIENDARAMALGEAWFGQKEKSDSMIAVNIGRGVGAGVVIDGKLYHGANDIAGEIGHMTIDIYGEVCQCGNRGCLQTIVSGPSIAKRAIHAVQEHQHQHSSLLNLVENDIGKITGETVYRAAKEGDLTSIHILEDTGTVLGIGLTNLIHIMNPRKIILGGGVSRANEFILEPIRQAIEHRALTPKTKRTEVVITTHEDDATLLGSIALLLEELFNPERSYYKV